MFPIKLERVGLQREAVGGDRLLEKGDTRWEVLFSFLIINGAWRQGLKTVLGVADNSLDW